MGKKYVFYSFFLILAINIFQSCSGGGGQKMNELTFRQGTFGFDLDFLKKQGEMIVLSGENNNAQVIVSPEYQGKVFTSTAEGLKGKSFGWINYHLLESETILDHMNAYGGEDRLWLGPEGGQFSIFSKPGGEMNIDNWFTPAPIDTESWKLISESQNKVEMEKKMTLKNYSGSEFNLLINRNIYLFDTEKANDILGIEISGNVNWVGYGSENIMTNIGENAWTRESGTLSIWMLDMFSPGDNIFIQSTSLIQRELLIFEKFFRTSITCFFSFIVSLYRIIQSLSQFFLILLKLIQNQHCLYYFH